jgi:hypothetical protein
MWLAKEKYLKGTGSFFISQATMHKFRAEKQ